MECCDFTTGGPPGEPNPSGIDIVGEHRGGPRPYNSLRNNDWMNSIPDRMIGISTGWPSGARLLPESSVGHVAFVGESVEAMERGDGGASRDDSRPDGEWTGEPGDRRRSRGAYRDERGIAASMEWPARRRDPCEREADGRRADARSFDAGRALPARAGVGCVHPYRRLARLEDSGRVRLRDQCAGRGRGGGEHLRLGAVRRGPSRCTPRPESWAACWPRRVSR